MHMAPAAEPDWQRRVIERAKELARVYEALVDYFDGLNEYGSSDDLWRGYFLPFAYAARRNR